MRYRTSSPLVAHVAQEPEPARDDPDDQPRAGAGSAPAEAGGREPAEELVRTSDPPDLEDRLALLALAAAEPVRRRDGERPRRRPRSRSRAPSRPRPAASTSPRSSLSLVSMSSRVILRSGTTTGFGAHAALLLSDFALLCRTGHPDERGEHDEHDDVDEVRHPRPVAVHQPAAVLLQRAQHADREEEHADADEQRAGEAEARVAPRPLSGSTVSCLAYAMTSSWSSRTVCCGLSATRLQSGRARESRRRARSGATSVQRVRTRVTSSGLSAQRGAGTGSGAAGCVGIRADQARRPRPAGPRRRSSRSRRWPRNAKWSSPEVAAGRAGSTPDEADDAVDVTGLGAQPPGERRAAEAARRACRSVAATGRPRSMRRELRLRAELDDAPAASRT